MTTPETPAPPGSRLLWALRFHARPLSAAALLTLLLTALAVGRLLLAPPTYTATAAVIATDLEFSAERVPRLAAAVAGQDSVLTDAVRRGGLPWSLEELRDEHVVVTPLEENVLVVIEGRDTNPQLAIRTANSVAEALATALERSGTAASFAVQERARRAAQDDRLVPVAVTAVAGLMDTAAVVVGLAALLLAARRPVTQVAEATQLTGVPVLTVVQLPRRRRPSRPLTGLAALQRSLHPRRAGTVLLTTTPDGAAVRMAVAESYAHLLGLQAEVTLVPSGPAEQVPSQILDDSRVLLHDRAQTLPADAGTVVVDGFDDEQGTWREPLPTGSTGVVVVPEGARQDHLLAVVARFVPEDLAGLVFVTRRGHRPDPGGAGAAVPSRWNQPDLRPLAPEPLADEPSHPATSPAATFPTAGPPVLDRPGG
jgi:capsular polysaccharide biosynthesis protein